MKKINSIIWNVMIILVISFASCSSEQQFDNCNMEIINNYVTLTTEEYLSIMDEDYEISQDEVNLIAENFINISDSSPTRSLSSRKCRSSTKEYISIEDHMKDSYRYLDSIPLYNVVISDTDNLYYAIVSADKRAPGVIAYVVTNSDSSDNLKEVLNCSNYKAISTLAKTQLIKDINSACSILPKLKNNTIDKICQNLKISRSSFDLSKVRDYIQIEGQRYSRTHGGVQMPEQQVILQKEPMSQILWDQHTPYNEACPTAQILISIPPIYFLTDGHVPAGCVTIACMMVEACVERSSIGGIPMDWNYYKNSRTLFKAIEGQSGGTPQVEFERATKAIRYIYDQLYSYSNYSYFDGKPYVHSTGSSFGKNYITSNFNCTSSQSFDPDIVLSSLNANKPVYIEGQVIGNTVEDKDKLITEGHAFVIDGYIICSKANNLSQISLTPETRSDIVKYYDMYWHLNLGWGDGSSAYFRLESDATCSPEFEDKYGRYNLMHLNSMTIIPNISKK